MGRRHLDPRPFCGKSSKQSCFITLRWKCKSIQITLVFGIEMLDEYKGHSVVSGKRMQQFGEGFQAASGRAHADDRKVVGRNGSRRGWASIGFAAVQAQVGALMVFGELCGGGLFGHTTGLTAPSYRNEARPEVVRMRYAAPQCHFQKASGSGLLSTAWRGISI